MRFKSVSEATRCFIAEHIFTFKSAIYDSSFFVCASASLSWTRRNKSILNIRRTERPDAPGGPLPSFKREFWEFNSSLMKEEHQPIGRGLFCSIFEKFRLFSAELSCRHFWIIWSGNNQIVFNLIRFFAEVATLDWSPNGYLICRFTH